MMFIRNLHAHNDCGIVLMWAHLHQGGLGHINNHNPKYLLGIFSALGYVLDKEWSLRLNRVYYNGIRKDQLTPEQLSELCAASVSLPPESFPIEIGNHSRRLIANAECTVIVLRRATPRKARCASRLAPSVASQQITPISSKQSAVL